MVSLIPWISALNGITGISERGEKTARSRAPRLFRTLSGPAGQPLLPFRCSDFRTECNFQRPQSVSRRILRASQHLCGQQALHSA